MPTYSFRCESCGHTQDELCSMNEYTELKDNITCPKCGLPMVRDWSMDTPSVVWKCECTSASGGRQPSNTKFNNYNMGKFIEETKIKKHNENENMKKQGKVKVKKKLEALRRKKNEGKG